MSPDIRRRLSVEFFGVFLVVFVGCGSIRLHTLYPQLFPISLIPYFFMSMVLVSVFFVAKSSGAHINPAVSWSLALVGWQPWRESLLYSGAHFLGGALASFVHWIVLPGTMEYGATVPRISAFSACVREAGIMFVFLFGILLIMNKAKTWWRFILFAVWFISVISYAGNYGTGLSLNPARSFGPNLFQGQSNVLWVYFLGPTIGCWAAFALYKKMDPYFLGISRKLGRSSVGPAQSQ